MSGIWLLPSAAILFLLAVGPVGAFLGILSPAFGFGLFLAAVAIAAASAIGLAGAAAFASATGRQWRQHALRAAIVPFLIIIPVMVATQSGDVPPMNDVSTDVEDRPQLAPDVASAPGQSEAIATTLDMFAQMQRESYPDIQPIIVTQTPADAFARALEVAREMPAWEITGSDPEAGRIKAIVTSGLFRFVDDVVIRVRPDANGARIDLRSRSRIGRSDLGANAARIRDFSAAFAGL